MRLRLAVAASLLAALAVIAVPSVASARVHHHPHHNYHLTINSFPNPVPAGDGVVIYGQLKGSDVGSQTITLYHHVAGGPPGFSVIGTATPDSLGDYEFTRPEGLVYTNRDWFVRGPDGSHSRTIHEHVMALVTLNASTPTADTGQRIVFSGHVTPNHAFQRVLLQEQNASGTEWHTLRSALIGPGSNYSVAYRFRTPGERDVRAELPPNARNIRSDSDSVSVTIQQEQIAGFTINTSAPIQNYGTLVTISGMLDQPSTTTPEGGVLVQLWGRPVSGGPFTLVSQQDTTPAGTYSFTVPTTVNTVYQARTAFAPLRHSAELWQGVRDLLTMTPSSPTSTVGGLVTFTGTVTPDKAGHLIFLERLGADGDWHPVEVRFVRFNSTFQFGWRFEKAGTFKFRARIYSDDHNVGTASTPVTITVSGVTPVTSLPPAS